MANRLIEDYAKHTGGEIYNKYLHQLSVAQTKMKGDPFMVCKGFFYLFNTSSVEISAKAKKESADFYLPKLSELSPANEQLASENDRFKKFLIQNNIPF